jgi:hypothetical protein
MNKRGLLSDALGILGAIISIAPWLYFDNPGWGSFLVTCIGAIFVGISRADSLSNMLGRGNAGDEFLRDSWIRLKSGLSKFK